MYKLLFFVILVLGCRKDSPTPSYGNFDYDNQVPLVCNDNPSEFYCKALVNGKNLCYSTNDLLYDNWHWFSTSITTTNTSVSITDTTNIRQDIELGIGGFGSSHQLPAPIFFYIRLPSFSMNEKTKDAVKRLFVEGTDLDITVPKDSVSKTAIVNNKFSISFFARCPKCNSGAGYFYTHSGIQEKGKSYLKVTQVEDLVDSYVITLQFSCKLYDNMGRYYADVKNGEMRVKYKF